MERRLRRLLDQAERKCDWRFLKPICSALLTRRRGNRMRSCPTAPLFRWMARRTIARRSPRSWPETVTAGW